MARFFQPARMPGSGAVAPSTQDIVYTTGQTFKKGAVLIFVAAGTVSEAAANPVINIAGIAMDPAASKPGFDPANSTQVLQVTGIQQEVAVALANSQTRFSGRLVSVANGDPTPPLQTHINEEYGVTKQADGTWAVDLDNTNKAVRIVDIDVDQKIAFFIFLPTALLLT